MVQSLGSDPICFDYNPPPGTQITLLSDPESGMIVTGKVSPHLTLHCPQNVKGWSIFEL